MLALGELRHMCAIWVQLWAELCVPQHYYVEILAPSTSPI